MVLLVKLKQANELISDKNYLISFYVNSLKILKDKNLEGTRGCLLLPKNIDSSFIDNPTCSFLSNGIILHMSCVNLNSNPGQYELPYESLYSHMIDANGIALENINLSLDDLIHIMFSSLTIAIAEVKLIFFNL